MILKTSPFLIQKNKIKDLNNSSKKYSTIDDLMTEENFVNTKTKTVHRRRDLDSLG